MVLIKQGSDLEKIPREDPVYPLVDQLFEQLVRAYSWDLHPYDPQAHGFIAYIEEADVNAVLNEIWDDWTLLDIPWEGVVLEEGFYQAVFLANDDFGIMFVIPDKPWVNGRLKEVLEYHLDPTWQQRIICSTRKSFHPRLF